MNLGKCLIMKKIFLLLFFAQLFVLSCKPDMTNSNDVNKNIKSKNKMITSFVNPEKDYGNMFTTIQNSGIFPDSKTFVDCTPKRAVEDIVKDFEKNADDIDLKKFVEDNFLLPHQYSSGFKSDASKSMEDHIEALWPVLTRQGSAENAGTLLAMPKDYIVPGGRFGEVYYWDSYFTMLGLVESGREELVENMIDNFANLIQTVGHIPNGNRSYYLSRSQPPFFAAMVQLLASKKGDKIYSKYLSALRGEYDFWMAGSDKLTTDNPAHRRVVLMPNNAVMNRYYDDTDSPRPEAFKEDVHIAKESGRPAAEVYRDLKAAAESGWDFSARWFADGKNLSTIETTNIIPVDLNSLLFNLEMVLAKAYLIDQNDAEVKRFTQAAMTRQDAMERYCWSVEKSFYYDYHWVNKKPTEIISMAGMYPFFFRSAAPMRMEVAHPVLQKELLRPGGFVSTKINSGQQWDAPNGWAPLQWIGIQGLRNYDQTTLASEVSKRWLALNRKVYKNTGKMVEKYNVQDMSLEAGGGEYPVQDGFGWSNGVAKALMKNEK